MSPEQSRSRSAKRVQPKMERVPESPGSDFDSSKQSLAFVRIKQSNLKMSELNEKAEEEIERCQDQIARQAS